MYQKQNPELSPQTPEPPLHTVHGEGQSVLQPQAGLVHIPGWQTELLQSLLQQSPFVLQVLPSGRQAMAEQTLPKQ